MPFTHDEEEPMPDLDEEIEKTRQEIEGKRERLKKLEAQREEQQVEELDLETFENMAPSERRELKQDRPERWRELMGGLRERNESKLDTSGQAVI